MIKSVRIMVALLEASTKYGDYKMWVAAVRDWVFTNTALTPAELGPYSVRSVARITLKPELYASLDNSGAMGLGSQSGAQVSWKGMLEHLWDRLGCNTAHLKIGLSLMKQGERDMVTFA